MAYDKCTVCKQWGWTDKHVCPPQWLCRMEGDSDFDDYDPVYATDAEEAAKDFAERYDQDGGEYHIVRGNDAIVLVKKYGETDAKIEKFSIWAEAVPTYYARELTQD